MRTESKTVVAPDEAQGQRLDQWLAARFPVLSRNEWQARIADNHVTINSHVVRASRRLNSGDSIAFSYTMRDEPVVPSEMPVLYEDANFLAVCKPAGLPAHPSGIYKTQTVTTLLVERGILSQPFMLHRLDRETSGVLILGRNREAAALFQKTLKQGAIRKSYLVAVEGIFPHFCDAKGFIYRLPDSRLPRQRFFSSEPPGADALEVQSCHTMLKTEKTAENLSLVRATLLTGRMHQIRATMHSLGYPVVGDKLYGVDAELYFRFADSEMRDEDWKKLRLGRSALHCTFMELPHPFTGQNWRIEAPLPADMASLF